MRPKSLRPDASIDLIRRIERLDGLPIRPASARATLDGRPSSDHFEPGPAPAHACTGIDPGWAVARLRPSKGRPHLHDPLAIVAGSPWWPSTTGPEAEALGRLWRHAVAVSLAARRLAREADDPDPASVGRAGLLHRLGLWAIAAVEPGRLVAWLAETDDRGRTELERSWVGTDSASLGRTLATRWALGPTTIDATWLHRDESGFLAGCADDSERLAFIRRGHSLAEQTPWALSALPSRDHGPLDTRVRLLMAEVQSRCGGPLADVDVVGREEFLSREVARLRLEARQSEANRQGQDRLISALKESDPTDRPEVWAERAGLALCDLPNVASARVVWLDPTSATEAVPDREPQPKRPASFSLPLGDDRGPVASVELWSEDGTAPSWPRLEAWSAWALSVADRARLRRKLDAAVNSIRSRVEGEDALRKAARLDALAEFAAGAGHELNNPLAVILGRAQLLLAREENPDDQRSLRAIIVQAQRAHRILRDLMFVARTPEPRPRPCSTDEILKASLRDSQGEAEGRGIRLLGDSRSGSPGKVWADPESLRHVADILLRNALEATPSGGTISVASAGDDGALRWIIRDNGRGLTAHEAAHLYDPFFCGRPAGRGLGLGLPRAARIIERAGGDISWQAIPGGGTSFQVRIPLEPIPPPDRARYA